MNSNNRKRSHGVEENVSRNKKQRIALYLDDYTPIRTIEVTNIGDNVCAGYLRGYFECYTGPVSDVTIVNRKLECNQEIRVGYVTFVVPEDAAKLICETQSNFKFTIKEAESIYQPKIDPNAFKFEQIDDTCLLHICSHLDLIDIVNLGKTSSRLRGLAEQIYINQTNFTFDPTRDSSINQKNVPIILQEMGSHIRSIHWRCLNDRQLADLTQYCHHINALRLLDPSGHLRLPSIGKNIKFFKNIESLHIENAPFTDVEIKVIITSASKLKSLELIHCPNIKGKFFTEWKNCELECLNIVNCESVSPAYISEFQRANKLIKYSSDTFDSFISCFTLPSRCLLEYTELGLALNPTTDAKLEWLKLDEVKRLKKLRLKCTDFRMNYGSTFHNFNNVFAAMSKIDTLTSITVERILIDADTIQCLGTIKNLEEITFNYVRSSVGSQLYSSIQEHLPKISKLSMNMKGRTEEIDLKSICDMISAMTNLTYFSHSSMTFQLLNMIIQVLLLRKRPRIEIGISKLLFYNQRKKVADVIGKAAVTLSLNE